MDIFPNDRLRFSSLFFSLFLYLFLFSSFLSIIRFFKREKRNTLNADDASHSLPLRFFPSFSVSFFLSLSLWGLYFFPSCSKVNMDRTWITKKNSLSLSLFLSGSDAMTEGRGRKRKGKRKRVGEKKMKKILVNGWKSSRTKFWK